MKEFYAVDAAENEGQLITSFFVNYPALNRDLLIAGAILHDIGKIHELTCERSITYTDRGQLVGHISLATLQMAELETLLGKL